MIIRQYPIRKSRNNWNIRFYSKHECSEECETVLVSQKHSLNNTLSFSFEKNKNYFNHKCQKNGSLEGSQIRISNFNKNNPETLLGPLIQSDEYIIPDKRIKVVIDYPLTKPLEAVITSERDGFTLVEILNHIKKIYQYIYNEEEKTASVQTYHLSKICEECINFEHDSYFTETVSTEECPICCSNDTNDQYVMLKCRHLFHKNCISEWLNNGSNCPLCRENVKDCSLCNGTFIIYYDYIGVVIPPEKRGIFINRNFTDGTFGIFGHDFTDLYLDGLRYDRKNKILTLDISSFV